jgi:predicted nucleotidyltransferase
MNQKPYSIDEIKERIAPVADRYGIEKIYLFGSYARGEAKPDSDIDFCIEPGKIRTLFQLSGFCVEAREGLDNEIDVVEMQGVYDEIKEEIEKDKVLIYG